MWSLFTGSDYVVKYRLFTDRESDRKKFPARSGSQWALIRAPGRKSLLVDRGDHELWLELTMVMGLSVDWGGNELWGELPITKVCWSPYQCSSQSPIPQCDHDYRLKNGLSLKYTDKTKRESELRNIRLLARPCLRWFKYNSSLQKRLRNGKINKSELRLLKRTTQLNYSIEANYVYLLFNVKQHGKF